MKNNLENNMFCYEVHLKLSMGKGERNKTTPDAPKCSRISKIEFVFSQLVLISQSAIFKLKSRLVSVSVVTCE